MSEAPVIEGTATEEPGHEIAVRAPAAVLAVTPQVKASELVERLAVVREAMDTAMQEDVDYGVIPGTNKPALLKPGAEKLSVLFQLDVQLVNEKVWGPGDHLTVMSHATVHHAPTGSRLGYGEGLCTTREKKYAKRRAELVCPDCAKPNVRRSKNAGEGFYCWRKTDGCGSTFAADDQRITGQTAGDIDNPDLPDLWNTVVKMAEKRARVDAVLAVTGASALFTQDIEDQATAAPPAAPQKATDVPFDADEPTAQPPIDATVEPSSGAGPTCTDAQARLIHMRAKGIDPQTLESILRSAAGASSPEAVPKALVDQVLERLAAAPKAA